jgi:hypothetical protein
MNPATSAFDGLRHGHAQEGPSNRSFGYTVGGILLGLVLAKWLIGGSLSMTSICMAVLGSALVLLALASPSLLTVPNRLWMKLGLLMFRVVNPVVMLLIYVTTFVPLGLLGRLRRRDPLAMSFDRAAASYWISRPRGEPVPATMCNQF